MLMRKKKGKKEIRLDHYAPDVTIAAVDYELVDTHDRLENAERVIHEFLAKTEPDIYCEAYFDEMINKENGVLLSDLNRQKALHSETNREIAAKHAAELERLRTEKIQKEEALLKLQNELEEVEKMYQGKNGGMA